MKTLLMGICFLLSTAANASGGGGGGGGGGESFDDVPPAQNSAQQLQQVDKLVKTQQWQQAEAVLRDLRRSDANSADVWNWSGYVARKSGRLPDAFPYYYKALAINPNHLGAHEYLGEAHLQNGDRQKAQDQLHILQGLCGHCEEAEELAAALKTAGVAVN